MAELPSSLHRVGALRRAFSAFNRHNSQIYELPVTNEVIALESSNPFILVFFLLCHISYNEKRLNSMIILHLQYCGIYLKFDLCKKSKGKYLQRELRLSSAQGRAADFYSS
jgi:hypothetical protein